MIGEKLGQGKGKRTGRRIVAVEPQFKVEVSFEDMVNLLGVEGMNIGTYTATAKPDGSLGGEGHGVFSSLEGEFVTWKGLGVGRLQAGGAVNYRGCLSFATTSAKLAAWNHTCVAFEFDVDAQGNTQSNYWEWK